MVEGCGECMGIGGGGKGEFGLWFFGTKSEFKGIFYKSFALILETKGWGLFFYLVNPPSLKKTPHFCLFLLEHSSNLCLFVNF